MRRNFRTNKVAEPSLRDSFRVRVIALCFAATVSSGAVATIACGGPAEAWTISAIGAQTMAITTAISAFSLAFGAQMEITFEQVISAMAVATKQEAVSANLIGDNQRESAGALVNAIKVQHQSDRMMEAYIAYNPAMGQGYKPCSTMARNKTLDGTFDTLNTIAGKQVMVGDVVPGGMTNSTGTAMMNRLQVHRDKFCSEAEANAGMCSLSQLPGGDTNAALLFKSTSPSSLEREAQDAYIQNVLGAPDQLIPKSAGASPAGTNYMLVKNTKDALQSVPAYSLRMVQAANIQSADLGNKSPNDVLQLRVNQYFGGKEAADWTDRITAQSPRGLMVEAVKMHGLEAWLHNQQYKQNQRIELNLAALAIAASDSSKKQVETKYQKMMHDNISAAIQ